MLAVLSFDLDAESAILSRGRRYADHASTMSHQAYGPLVGVPRILALLAEYDLPATFFVPGLSAERYPAVVESVVAAGHEVAHHSYSHRSPLQLGEAGERADFERALGALSALGIAPTGHRAAYWEASWQTPRLVAEYGLTYDSSFMDDDRPYRLDTGAGEIVELPVHWSLDDWEQYAFLPEPDIGQLIEAPSKVLEMWTSELDAMRRHDCLFMLTMHPFLSGRPSRLEALRSLVEIALSRGDVEFRSAHAVATGAVPGPVRRLTPLVADPDTYPDE